jgi:alpha-1,3-rhamnosyl/mannosyltransferase
MRVVVSQQAALGLKTGVGHYTHELLRCLRQQAEPHEIEAYPEGWVRRMRQSAARARPYLEACQPDRARGHETASTQATRLRRAAVAYLRQAGRALVARHFRLVCSRRGYDLYHEPNFIPLPGDCPTVTTLHDLSVLLHPEWHPADRVLHFERHFERELRRCVHVLAVSEFTRQEVIRTLHLAPEKVARTYNGIRSGMKPLEKDVVADVLRRLGLPPRYVLYLGTIEPRKNVKLLLQAYCSLPERLRAHWPLLLVGSWGWNTAEVAEYYHDEARHRGVIHIGYVADEQLAALYNGARALVFPSHYEGFGLPPVEMMACGGAVLASTAGAVVETVGSKAHLIEPHDLDGWRDALLRVLHDDDWWRWLRRGVTEIARPFTWERCAADTLRVYRLVCGVSSHPILVPDAPHFPRRVAG